MSKRKTANDYRKEFNDLTQKRNALKKRIINRASELKNAFPDAVIGRNFISFTPKEYTATMFWGDHNNIRVDDALYLIERIEEYNKQKAKHIQKKIEGFN